MSQSQYSQNAAIPPPAGLDGAAPIYVVAGPAVRTVKLTLPTPLPRRAPRSTTEETP